MAQISRLKTATFATALWALWYQFFLKRVIRSNVTWGPRTAAVILTSCLRWFGVNIGQCSFAMEKALPTRQAFMGVHPHGVYMVTAGIFCANVMVDPSNKPEWFIGVADLLFRIPIISEMLALVNGRSASPTVTKSLLEAGKSVGVVPGGLSEQVRTDPDVEAVYFPPNLGFIRVALEQGVPLFPVYLFGENQLYGQNQFTRKANLLLKRFFGIGSLFMIVGDLVEVGPPEANPSEERVRQVFAKYVNELRRIFDLHAHEHLPPGNLERGLKIVWRGHEDELKELLQPLPGHPSKL